MLEPWALETQTLLLFDYSQKGTKQTGLLISTFRSWYVHTFAYVRNKKQITWQLPICLYVNNKRNIVCVYTNSQN